MTRWMTVLWKPTAAVRELWGSGRIKRLKEYVERKRREEMELGKQRKCRNDLAI